MDAIKKMIIIIIINKTLKEMVFLLCINYLTKHYSL